MDVIRREGWLTAPDGTRLFERRWLPEASPRAAVALIHGYAEHCGRYEHVGTRLAARGYAVHAIDLRGHGRSDGPRALVRSFAEYLLDTRTLLDSVRSAHPGATVMLLGHSMGGTIVALAAVTDRPDVGGILLSGGSLTLGGMGWLRRNVTLTLGRLLPRLPVVRLAAADISRDPAVVDLYAADPLVYHGRIKAGLLAAMLRALARIEEQAHVIDRPLLAMHGTEDRLTSPDGSRRLVERASASDKTLRLYDGLHHEIFNEPEQDQVLDDVLAWLDARSAR